MGSYVSYLYEKEGYDGINEEVLVKENDFWWSFCILMIHQNIFIGLQLMLNAGRQ